MPESTANDRFEIQFEMSSGLTYQFTVDERTFRDLSHQIKHVRGGSYTAYLDPEMTVSPQIIIFFEHVCAFRWEKIDDSGEGTDKGD